MKKYITLIICSFIIAINLSCSEEGVDETGVGSLKGTVVSAGDNKPLSNVKITTTPGSTTVFTNSDGKFVFDELTAGEYSVQAEIDDYQTAFESTKITTGNTSTVVFELEISTINNKPPSAPTLLSPADNAVVDSTSVTFKWSASDPDDDPLTFALELRNDKNQDVERFENLTDTTYTFSPLVLGTKYFWQVSAEDGINSPVLSAVNTFTVVASPTGNRYLFVRNIGGNNVIFSSDDEGNEFQLTSENTNSFRPRRNVAANKIAYLQTTGAQVDIFTMNLDGTDKQKVTSSVRPNGFNLNEINIAWPQNTDRIYFPSFDKLYRIRSNGQGLQLMYQTVDGSLISEVDVDETHNLIALKTNNLEGYNVSIFTINFNGDIQDTVLTNAAGAASGLNLSVTGKKLLYSYDVDEFQSPNYRRLNSRMFLYDLVLDTAADISGDKPAGTNDLEPIFSPNEAFVIFTNTSNDGNSPRHISTLPINDPDSREILFNNAFMPDYE